MLFNTFQFFIFFIVAWLVFLCLRGTPRRLFLLGASYYFYMCWSTKYIWVIWGITVIDFVAGILIEKAENVAIRKCYLALSLGCNVGLLVVFKYSNFFAESLSSVVHVAGLQWNAPLLHVLLPVGLSFHTFQAMSYTLDVYARKSPAERNFLSYALYVAFFPQMVAGPIERPNQLLPQFDHEPKMTIERVRSGLSLAIWGLFKKMVIADAVANFVGMVYARPQNFPGSAILLATVLFAIQIYCDFSGYTDMALGLARIMGYELRINFRQPYFSRSIGEFWHRWHISLSSWFRDYLYIPLGGNRVALPRYYLNLFVTFLVSGLWHGAAWTFVLWGGLHGFYLIFGHATSRLRRRVRQASGIERVPMIAAIFQTLFTVSLVTLAWVFFRAANAKDALYVVTHILRFGGFDSSLLAIGGIPRANAPFLVCFVVCMFCVDWWLAHPCRVPRIWSSRVFRQACYWACTYNVIFFGVFGHVDFIYFQF